MVFSSVTFLFLFLPITLLCYFATPKAARNVVLLLASLFFAGWGDFQLFKIMVISSLVNYGLARAISNSTQPLQRKILLFVGIFLNLGSLIYFKYFNFLTENVNTFFALLHIGPLQNSDVLLPIGISFLTFHAISYLMDVYRRRTEAQHSLLSISLYLALFPQLIAGPIIRYADVAEELNRRSESLDLCVDGIKRFILGLSKKVLIANTLGAVADRAFANPRADLPTLLAWFGIFSYTLQLYFDFSGYSDMAIGLGKIFGFHFKENFNYPYIANSIQDFWRRWHISLSSWFRDYLYFPLGGNRISEKRTYINLFIVFFLTGLWHGAKWNFIVWGLFHGLFLVIERVGLDKRLAKCWKPISHSYTLFIVMTGWVFFRSENLPSAMAYLWALAGFGSIATYRSTLSSYLDNQVIYALIAGMFFSMPVSAWMRPRFASSSSLFMREAISSLAFASLFLFSIIWLAGGTYNPFIYFRF